MKLQLSLIASLALLLRPTVADAEVNDLLPRRAVLGLSFTPVPQELAKKLNLGADQGLVARKPIAGLSGEKAGVVEGDVVLSLNGKPVTMVSVAAIARESIAGSELTLSIVRDGKPMELKSKAVEKPRDPGNANYEVTYSQVVSHGKRIRTIITRPKTPGKHPGFMFIQGFSPISYDFTLEGSKGDVATIDGPILFEFTNSGFVTLRVEKPGVGDSEGGAVRRIGLHHRTGHLSSGAHAIEGACRSRC